MRRSARRAALLGLMAGLVAVTATEVVRPRGGTGVLIDWDEVRSLARVRLSRGAPKVDLGAAARRYRHLAAELEGPLLEFVGGLAPGSALPPFQALDREGWLDLNLGILRRAVEPVLERGRLPNSLLVAAGRSALDRYAGFLLEFLGRRVLGQYDPQLLGVEPLGADGLYLVETNVDEWVRRKQLPGADLRRWLILHEMTHAWQFASHPWLRRHLEGSMRALLESAPVNASTAARVAAFAGILPAQWRAMRGLQATMSLVEGHSNLVMNELGRELLPGFEALQAAYSARGKDRNVMEILVWRLTGLDLKLQQYRHGEAFAQAVHDDYGMGVLNLAWASAESMPDLDELTNPDRWYRRVTGRVRRASPSAPPGPFPR